MTMLKVLDAPFIGARLKDLIHPWTICEYGQEVNPITGALLDMSGVKTLPDATPKPAHHLTPYPDAATGPSNDVSSLQRRDGSAALGRLYNGSSQYYQIANHDTFNCFDQDFTLTAIVKGDSAGGTGLEIFDKYEANVSGLVVYLGTSGYPTAKLSRGSATATVTISTNAKDSRYHIIQLVRDTNYCTLYLDGVAGTRVDVTGYGLTNTHAVTIGADRTPTNYWQGGILYLRLDAQALTANQLLMERQELRGWAAGSGNAYQKSWSFSRTGDVGLFLSDKTYRIIPANIPRLGGDGGGLVLEKSIINSVLRSQEFDNTYWTTGAVAASVNPNTTTSPDMTVNADSLHEDATAASNHYIVSGNLSETSGTIYTRSVYAKAGLRQWLKIQHSAGAHYAYFDLLGGVVGTTAGTGIIAKITPVSYGFYRCSISFPAPATSSTAKIQFRVAEADNDDTFDGLDQDSLYLWGAQCENNSFSSSYIATTSGPTTKSAEFITLDCSGIIPTLIGNSYNYKKLLISWDAKEMWNNVANMGASGKIFFSLGGNAGTANAATNYLRFYVSSTAQAYWAIYGTDSVLHGIYSNADPVDFGVWNSYLIYIDFADLANCYASINGSTALVPNKTAMTGTADFNLTDVLLRLGATYGGTANNLQRIRNLKIWIGE